MVRKIAYSVSEREHWISAVGGMCGILGVGWISQLVLGPHAALLIASSMGSSAVMLFAAPHGAMSQPWPLVGGHTVSGIAGIACAQWFGSDIMLASALAVALSIAAMYTLRCLHAPGGATALSAVLGGDVVHAMGYTYLFNPVLLNVVVLLVITIAFNYPFAWRRYPQVWCRKVCEDPVAQAADAPEKCMIPHSDLVYALSQIDTFVDVSEEDLQRIYTLALGPHADTVKAEALAGQPVEALR